MSASDIFSTQDEIVKNLVQELSAGGFISAAMMKDIGNRSNAKGTDNSSAYECVNLSKYQWVSGDFSKSLKIIKCLKEATQLDPNYADAWASLAQSQTLAYSSGQLGVDILNEALTNADRAISLDPKNANYHYVKSGVYQLQRKWELMFAESDKAIELAPNDAEVVSGVVLTYIASGECTDKQRADFNAAKGTYTTGLCQWQKGFEAGLKADLLDKANSFPLRHYPMANLYIRSGQWDKALEHLTHITYPGEFWYEFFSALAMNGKGSKDQATKHFETIKKTLGSSKVSDLQVPLKKWDWGESSETLKPLFISYGFN